MASNLLSAHLFQAYVCAYLLKKGKALIMNKSLLASNLTINSEAAQNNKYTSIFCPHMGPLAEWNITVKHIWWNRIRAKTQENNHKEYDGPKHIHW